MSIDPNSWLVVANPVSGRGLALRRMPEIERLLDAAGLSHRIVVSEYAGHTRHLVAEGVQSGWRRVLVAGGDGSLNEAANGVFEQSAVAPHEVLLAVLPVGTGNDWARTHEIPREWRAAIALVAGGRARLLDAGRVDFDAPGMSPRWFVNVFGTGFDAAVVERTLPRWLGAVAYLGGLASALAMYRPRPLTVTANGERRSDRLFVLFACLGRYCGGGMHVAPGAVGDDGLFDLVRIRHLGRIEVLANLRRLFDGTLPSHPKVSSETCTELRIDCEHQQSVETDGELAGTTPVTVRLLPAALRMVTGV